MAARTADPWAVEARRRRWRRRLAHTTHRIRRIRRALAALAWRTATVLAGAVAWWVGDLIGWNLLLRHAGVPGA